MKLKFLNIFNNIKKDFGKENFQTLINLQIFTIFVSILEVFGISLLLPVIKLVGDDGPHHYVGLELSTVQLQLLLITCILIVTILVLTSHRYVLSRGAWLGGELSLKVFSAKYGISYTELLSKPVSFWSNNIINETARTAHQVIIPVTKLIGKLIFSTLMLIVAFWTNFLITWIVFALLTTFYLTVYLLVRPRLAQASVDISNSTEKRLKLINDSYFAYGEISIFRLQSVLIDKFATQSRQFGDALGRTMVYGIAPRYLLEGLVSLSVGIAAIYISLNPSRDYNIDEFVFLSIVIVRLLPSAQEVYQSIAAIKSHWSAFEAAILIIQTSNRAGEFKPKQITIYANPDVSPKMKVQFDELVLNPEHQLLDISFELAPGEFVTIVGPSGSGKSSILKAICGLTASHKDSVILHTPTNTQFRWAYVGQQSAIIGNNIISNIILNQPYDDSRFHDIIKGCKLLRLHERFESRTGQPFNFEMEISGGEKQRIAIARALYQQCDGYIFDEATSALDLSTENDIIDFIRTQTRNSYCLSVAHRPSIIDLSDKIIEIVDNTCITKSKRQ